MSGEILLLARTITAVVFCFTLSGCTPQKPPLPQKNGKSTMSPLRITPWIDREFELHIPGGNTSVKVHGRKAECTFDIDSNTQCTVVLAAFISPSTGHVWAGTMHECYVDTDDGVVGLQMKSSALLVWYDSILMCSKQEASPNVGIITERMNQEMTVDQLIVDLETGARYQAHGEERPWKQSIHVILENENPFFNVAAPHSSQPGTPRILKMSVDKRLLGLVITNQSGEYKARLWIDANTRKIVKATCDPFSMKEYLDTPDYLKNKSTPRLPNAR